jgi:hypothetical protein
MTYDPDQYLHTQHTNHRCPKPLIKLDEGYEMLKRGASRSEVVRRTGLTAEQVGELKSRARSSHHKQKD